MCIPASCGLVCKLAMPLGLCRRRVHSKAGSFKEQTVNAWQQCHAAAAKVAVAAVWGKPRLHLLQDLFCHIDYTRTTAAAMTSHNWQPGDQSCQGMPVVCPIPAGCI